MLQNLSKFLGIECVLDFTLMICDGLGHTMIYLTEHLCHASMTHQARELILLRSSIYRTEIKTTNDSKGLSRIQLSGRLTPGGK